jgi:serine phosphatase RsbU (regulator of sigma subunit)/anti-sigma regulatory factor (Ser/Thr protein kinase)
MLSGYDGISMSKSLDARLSKQTKKKVGSKRASEQMAALLFQIESNDPIIEIAQKPGEIIAVDQLELDSPALRNLRENGVRQVVPLNLNGKLAGLLNLGPRLYEQELSVQDRMLLMMLANQAVSATRIAEWLREHPGDTLQREHLYRDLRIARLIQDALQPQTLPEVAGWHFRRHYQPAEIVGGDFLDVLELPDHRLAVFIGDVNNKGIPCALVMAIARSVLRSAAREFVSPQRVLRLANELLTPETPPNMSVTCFYAVIQPETGLMQYANAGHTLPFRCDKNSVASLDVTGMPLGLLPGMEYEMKEVILQPGECILLYSDGCSEARDVRHAMAGTRRVQSWASAADSPDQLIQSVLDGLKAFAGPDWQQEDDLTLLAVERLPLPGQISKDGQMEEPVPTRLTTPAELLTTGKVEERRLAQFALASEPGNERLAADQVLASVSSLGLSTLKMDQMRTAVAETALNAMEHGNHYQKELPTGIEVGLAARHVVVRVTDSGGGRLIPEQTFPDLEAKLAGLQSPRGWGLFLIRKMVDEMHVTHGDKFLTVELVFSLEGEPHGQ